MASVLQALKEFKDWPPEDRQAVESKGRVRDYAPKEDIFQEGSKGDSLYIILSGGVQIQKRVKNQDTVLAILKAGEPFGEMALFEKENIRSAAVVATEDSTLAKISKANFEKLCNADYEMGYMIFRNITGVLVDRLNKANIDVLKLTTAFSIALEGG